MPSPSPARIRTTCHAGVYTITLDDPARRNALSTALFEQLESAFAGAHEAATCGSIVIVRLRATGPAFCSGFDLEECVRSEHTLGEFVRRLGALASAIRVLPAIVVAEVQGPALAGGCALVAACDIVCASTQATFGYPVHRIGVSPAVSLPMLLATIWCGRARTLALSGEIIDAARAKAIGLVAHLAPDHLALDALVSTLVQAACAKSPVALRATKLWLNELDGTLPTGQLGSRADAATEATAALCELADSRQLLSDFWRSRRNPA